VCPAPERAGEDERGGHALAEVLLELALAAGRRERGHAEVVRQPEVGGCFPHVTVEAAGEDGEHGHPPLELRPDGGLLRTPLKHPRPGDGHQLRVALGLQEGLVHHREALQTPRLDLPPLLPWKRKKTKWWWWSSFPLFLSEGLLLLCLPP